MSQSATPATQNDMTACLETFEQEMFCRRCFAASPIDTATCLENQRHFRHVSKQIGMSQSATRATQNDMTTCLETFEKERFCSFPHRHGDAPGKRATRDETRGCRKTSISYETFSSLTFSTRYQTGWNVTKCHACHAKRHDNLLGNLSKRRGFAASPIDTARPQENQRLEHFVRDFLQFSQFETCRKDMFCSFPHRHGEATGKPETRVGASKRAFRTRLPPSLTLCSFKIDVFLRVFLRTWKFATSKSMFRARLPSIFSTCHKMPRLPRNLHLVATWRSPANAIYKKHATRHV